MILLYSQIDRISAIAAKYVGKPVVSYPLLSAPVPPRPLDLGVSRFSGGQPASSIGTDIYGNPPGDLLKSVATPTTEADKPMIIEFAVTAMDELLKMAQMGEPLWTIGMDGNSSVLNEDEYISMFPHAMGPKPSGFKCEATRETAMVIMNHINLVEILMDLV